VEDAPAAIPDWSSASSSELLLLAPSCLVRHPLQPPPSRDPRSPIAAAQVKTFGLAAELGTPKLLQQMAKPIVLLHHALAFCKRRIALGGELSHQFSQAIEIIGESIDRHDRIESDSRTAVLFSNPPDSRSRSTHDVAVEPHNIPRM